MPGSLESILRFRFAEARLESNDTSSVVYRGQIAQTNLIQIVRDFVTGCQNIMADASRSPSGRRDEVRELGAVSLKRVGELKPQTLSYAQTYRDTLVGELSRKVSGSLENQNDPGFVLREIETRRSLRGLDNMARMLALQAAIESGDELTYSAVTRAPAFAPLLDERIITEGQRLWIERQYPDLAADVAEANRVFEIVNDNFQSVERGIAELAEAPQDRLGMQLNRLSAAGVQAA